MSKPLRVLIAEDSEDDALLVVREFERGGYDVTFERVETAEAMNAALDAKEWDVVLADYAMPQFSGLDALKLLQESGHDLPFIIVSGTIGEETAVAAMKAGAHDYLMKDNLARLAVAVERELQDAEVRRERKRAEEELTKHREHLEELVKERTAELRKTVNLMAGREVRMAELKEVLRKLRAQLESAGLTPVADDPLKETGKGKS